MPLSPLNLKGFTLVKNVATTILVSTFLIGCDEAAISKYYKSLSYKTSVTLEKLTEHSRAALFGQFDVSKNMLADAILYYHFNRSREHQCEVGLSGLKVSFTDSDHIVAIVDDNGVKTPLHLQRTHYIFYGYILRGVSNDGKYLLRGAIQHQRNGNYHFNIDYLLRNDGKYLATSQSELCEKKLTSTEPYQMGAISAGKLIRATAIKLDHKSWMYANRADKWPIQPTSTDND
ncbi:hypothetical protein ASL83_003444 [Vibrio parahaemolyticus]|nr:hypothetical protein [Vibrio parahaemolyticus]EJO2026039.1 hypothetical protein [Vibrio parahaemolyticus]